MDDRWLEVTLPVPADRLERVCDILTANGMAGLVVEEEGDFLRFLEQNRQYWDYVDEGLAQRMKGASRVKFYVPDSEQGQRQLRQYLAGLEEYEPQTVSLREEDWATSWQKYYQPIPVGRRVYIVPDWMRGQAVPEGRTPLYLNPGLTFGTGAHPTTQLCLELLEQVLRPGDRVLDLGCGSGILAIAALALGACGVQVGTCLLVSQECPIHDNYKQAILKAKDSDTTVTGRSVNAPVRILKNQMSREYLKLERAGAERMELEKFTLGSLRRAVFDGDVKTGSLMCGQTAGLLHEIRPLRTILEELCSGCRDTVRRLAEEV